MTALAAEKASTSPSATRTRSPRCASARWSPRPTCTATRCWASWASSGRGACPIRRSSRSSTRRLATSPRRSPRPPGPVPALLARAAAGAAAIIRCDGRQHGPARADDATDAGADEVEELRRQLDDKQDRLLRALAETDNIRRRAQRDREDYVRTPPSRSCATSSPCSTTSTVRSTAARAARPPGVVEGVELIQRELLRVLERPASPRYSALGPAVRSHPPRGDRPRRQRRGASPTPW